MIWAVVEKVSPCLEDGNVHELLINPEEASTSPVFEENVEKSSCFVFQ
jgi:hypothetical protein